MRIGKFLNISQEEVLNREYNIFFGISLGNKFFTPVNIRSYIIWALENTKDKIIVLIPDKIQAINYEVKNDYSPRRAISVALRKGLEIENVVKKIVSELQVPDSKIKILHWNEIEDESYLKKLKVITEKFEKDPIFKSTVIEMVEEVSHFRSLKLSGHQYEKLAQYILNELPVLVSGLKIDNVQYELFPYPGFANLDYLALDLQEGKSFPELTKQLDIQEKLKLIELYTD